MPHETFCDIAECLAKGHLFRTVWSDARPEKVHLTCVNCTDVAGRDVYVAFADKRRIGDGFGRWSRVLKREPEEFTEELRED